MIGLDTNVLCRYLLADDPAQTRLATKVIDQALAAGTACYISKIVLCELVWVFESCTSLSRERIAETIDNLLHTEEIEIEDRDSVRRALALFQVGKADFADYLIGDCNLADGCERTVTFDRALKQAPGFEVL